MLGRCSYADCIVSAGSAGTLKRFFAKGEDKPKQESVVDEATLSTNLSTASTPADTKKKFEDKTEDVAVEEGRTLEEEFQEKKEDHSQLQDAEKLQDEDANDDSQDTDDAGADAEWAEEERKLRAENDLRIEKQRSKGKKVGMKEKVALLDNLLQKAAAYTAFLRERMKEVHQDNTPSSNSKSSGKNAEEQRDPRQPKLITGGVMRKYQIEGMMWICSLYENGLNGILADEMGLGKTVQSVSFLAHLYSMGVKGPFMVVAPLSTVTNWQREFARWAPSIDTVLYHGSKEERRLLREQIGFENKIKHPASKSFPVIITSFEVAMNDARKLANLNWKYLIVDEGHRLKNKDCRLLRELKSLNSDNRLLLSGTPLQNNLTELWSLLHFILPDIFQDLATFQTWFDFDEELHAEKGTARIIEEESKNKTVSKLHAILDPFLLRRLKTDVLINLPKKREYILMAPLTESQEKINKSIADGNLDSFVMDQTKEYEETDGNWERQGAVNNKAKSLMNVLMQMRKNCNHPYLFTAPFDALGNIVVDERLVKSAGKLQLLDRMLTILKKNGHKVLIFSQVKSKLSLLQFAEAML
eukprot:334985-Hanusia_phi.AAC.1